jgi:hypothetical protein
LEEHWASITKVVGSNPTVARHIFQACPVWGYTQSNITQASYSPEYITPTPQISCFYQFKILSYAFGKYPVILKQPCMFV